MTDHIPDAAIFDSINSGLHQLGIEPEANLVSAYLTYLQRLAEWNSAYNLTAIRDYQRMVSHHVLDSLSILPFIHGNHCIDVGTGAGLPGLILALAVPHVDWVLLDSNRKKIRFVNQVCLELDIHNVETVCRRAESFMPSRPFSTITCRAYARLDKILKQTRHMISADTSLLAMKGENCIKEVQLIDKNAFNVRIHEISVPGINEHRSLVEVRTLPSPS